MNAASGLECLIFRNVRFLIVFANTNFTLIDPALDTGKPKQNDSGSLTDDYHPTIIPNIYLSANLLSLNTWSWIYLLTKTENLSSQGYDLTESFYVYTFFEFSILTVHLLSPNFCLKLNSNPFCLSSGFYVLGGTRLVSVSYRLEQGLYYTSCFIQALDPEHLLYSPYDCLSSFDFPQLNAAKRPTIPAASPRLPRVGKCWTVSICST